MKYKNIIIGLDCKSINEALKTDSVILFTEPSPPMPFEPDYNSWHKAYNKLCLAGRVLFHLRSNHVYIDAKTKQIKVLLSDYGERYIEYESVKVFDTKNLTIEGNHPKLVNSKNFVYDYFKLTSVGKKPPIKLIKTIDLIDQAWYYKDKLVTMMTLSNDHLSKVEYSDTYVKFYIQNLLKQNGYVGRKNGFDSNGLQKHLTVEVTSTHREVLISEYVKYNKIKDITFYNG